MTKEKYHEIKKISGEELRELLSDLDNIFDLGTGTLIGDSYLTSTNNQFSIYFGCILELVIYFFSPKFEKITI